MKRIAWDHWSFGSSLATSAAVHGGVLLVALVGWNVSQNAASFPVDAIEIAVGDFFIPSGVTHVSKPAQPKPTVDQSPVDMAADRTHDEETQDVAQAEETPQGPIGQGGDTASSAGAQASEWDSYRMRLRAKIHEALIYPRVSKNLGETGQVTVKLDVLRDGTISDIQVAQPSAFDRLNAAAVDTVKRVARLDPFPPTYAADRYSALVPIAFTLK